MLAASAEDLVAVATTAVALYATTFVLVRMTGRRTLAQLSPFDALITIALGSIFATSIVSEPPSFDRGAVAVLTLLVLQMIVGAVRQRFARFRRLLDFQPQRVLEEGERRLDRSPFGPQLAPDDVDAAIRAAGYGEDEPVAVVVLESNGTFSVLPRR